METDTDLAEKGEQGTAGQGGRGVLVIISRNVERFNRNLVVELRIVRSLQH